MITFYTLCQINDLAQRCLRRPAPPAYSQHDYPDDDVVIVWDDDNGIFARVKVDGQEIAVYYTPCR